MSLRPWRASSVDDPVAQRHGALLIGLDGEAEAFPAVCEQLIVGDQRLDDVHRQLEPVGLLGVDGEMDVGLRRHQRQLADDRHQRRHGLGVVRNS